MLLGFLAYLNQQLYGANASGKSNVILALEAFRKIIVHSINKKPSESFLYKSFAFDEQSKNLPTEFEISLVVEFTNNNGLKVPVRVDYGFSYDSKRIYEEWLFVYPKGRAQTWFHRKYDRESDLYDWNLRDYLKGEKTSWKNQTREDKLFLSTVVSLNSNQLLEIMNEIIGSNDDFETHRRVSTYHLLLENEQNKKT